MEVNKHPCPPPSSYLTPNMNKYTALAAPEEKVESVRTKAGRTIEEILRKESEFDIYALLGASELDTPANAAVMPWKFALA
jgi:hypothetical protein